MSKFISKRTNLQHALDRLRESIDEFHQYPHIHSVQDGVLHRFELTYELSWKTLKAYFEETGSAEVSSPRAVFKEAYAQKIIGHEENWLSMINDRNLSSHVYQEQMAREIVLKVQQLYIHEFTQLLTFLTSQSDLYINFRFTKDRSSEYRCSEYRFS